MRQSTTDRLENLNERHVVAAAAAIAAMPIFLAVVSVLAADWYAGGDRALEYLRVADVFGSNTPLVGSWSRWGWSHPGPMLFWILAPFEFLFGQTGLLIGAGIVNAAAAAAAVVVAGRRGGQVFASLVALGAVLLTLGFGLTHVIDPWNPSLSLFVFYLFLVSLWSASTGDTPAWWVVVLGGSFCAQAHIGYVPLVVALAGMVVIWRIASRWFPGDESEPRGRMWASVAAALGVVLWIPPLVEQITTSPGNLRLLLDFVRSGNTDAPWGFDLGIIGRQFGARLPWITGDSADADGLLGTSNPLIAALVVIALVALSAVLFRRGKRCPALAASLAVAAAVVGIFATSRYSGLKAAYLVDWWRVIAAFAAAALAFGAFQFLSARAAKFTSLGVVVLVLVVGVATSVTNLPAEAPQANLGEAIAELAGPVAGQLDPAADYVVAGTDHRFLLASGVGLHAALEDLGLNVFTAPTELSEIQYGEWRIKTLENTSGEVRIVELSSVGRDWIPPDGSEELARWDPLSWQERARWLELEEQIGEFVPITDVPMVLTDELAAEALRSGAPSDAVEEFQSLQRADAGFAVFLVPLP